MYFGWTIGSTISLWLSFFASLFVPWSTIPKSFLSDLFQQVESQLIPSGIEMTPYLLNGLHCFRQMKSFELVAQLSLLNLIVSDRSMLLLSKGNVLSILLALKLIDLHKKQNVLPGCHDRDILPHPVHPYSHLHAALFTPNSPHPNPIHTQTLSPPVLTFTCTPQHLRRLCKRALLFLSVSRKHH